MTHPSPGHVDTGRRLFPRLAPAFPGPVLFIALMALALLGPTRAEATVTLTDNGSSVTMANGLISVTIQKGDGKVTSIVSNALPNVNLIDPRGIGLELTHIGAGPQTSSSNDYWVNISAGGPAVYSVVENSGTMVDIQIRNPTATGDLTTYPNGLWDWTIHHILRDGDSGFYTYHVWRHHANQPESYWDADSWQGYTNGSLFAASPINTAWDFCGVEKNGISIGGAPPRPDNENAPGEVEILPTTSYFTQPTGQYYEPNWPIFTQPTGLTYYLYPTWTKYDWPTYLGATTSYRNTWGVACDLVGIWHCNASSEWRNGGPTKLSGAMSGDYMYMDDDEGHGLGGTNTTVASGQEFVKMIGPFFTYVNTGTNHNELWADAQARGAREVANWPYAWVNETEADYHRERGTVKGRITAATGQSTANAVVILGMPVSATYPDWIWQGTINYLYWTTADAQGNFTIPKVNPGTYTLYSYVPGIFVSGDNGELIQDNVAVTANGTTNLGTIHWNPPRAQALLFQIGIPDRSTQEYRFGNLMKQFGLWWRYANEKGTSDLNFNVGTSNVANDWYYAQPIFALADGGYCFPHWNINFNLTAVPPDPVSLTLDLAGGYGTRYSIYVNGNDESPYGGSGTNSGADIYRDVVQVGQWQQYVTTIPSTALKTGSNTVQIQVRQPGFNGTWDTSGGWPDLVAGGLMYDAIKLEAGPQTTQLIQNGVYKIGSGLNGFVAQVENNGGTANTAVVEWPFEFLADQEWTITDLGNDDYSIIALNSGMALTVPNASKIVEAGVVQAPYTGATDQQWHAVLNTSGGLSFVNMNSGLALDITGERSDYQNKIKLIQDTPNNGKSQSWFVTPQTYGPPDVATGLTATAGNGEVNLSWTASQRATSYTIMRGASPGQESTTVATNVTNPSYTDTGVTNGITYYYVVVAATSSGGSSPNSNEASSKPAPPIPAPPVNLFAAAGNGRASLTWDASPYASHYTVLRGTASGDETSVVAGNVTVTSATSSGLTNGTKYYYVVTAANISGTSGKSNEATVTPTASAPAVPQDLTALAGNKAIGLAWSVTADAATYIILRGTTSGKYTSSTTISAASTRYIDTDVTNGLTYYYVVEARNANGTSGTSNQASAVPANNPPAAPTGLKANAGNQEIHLAWNASTGATGYILVRGTASGVYTTTLAQDTPLKTYTDSGLANGNAYYYAVQATSLSGTSGKSTPVTATPSRPSGTLAWTGNTNEIWDTATRNWQYGGQSVNYQDNDSPVFGDGGNANSVNVFLSGPVTPGNVTVNATHLNYAFAGVGSITGTTGLTFTGNGNTLTVGISNGYSGNTTIQNGTLILQDPGNLGASEVVFESGTLSTNYGTAGLGMENNTFLVPAGRTGAIIMAANMGIGPVTGAGIMNITATGGTGSRAESLCGNWGGNFTGTLNISSTEAAGSLLTGYYNGGNPDFDGDLANATVNLDNVSICSWDGSKGNTMTFGALNGTSTSAIIGSQYGGGMTLNIGGLNTNSVFAGSITDSTNGNGNTTLIKSGTGGLTLSGSCAYTGSTTVSQGNLTIAGILSGNGTALTVSPGASLGGTGSIVGTVTVNSGASLLVSATGNLTVNGNVSLGGSVSVSAASKAVLPPGTYTLLAYTGAESGTPTFSYVPQSGFNQKATFDNTGNGVISMKLSGPPGAPTGLKLTPGNGQIQLSWTASPTATSYSITRGTSSGVENTTVSAADTSTSFTNVGLTGGTIYYFEVTASNSYGIGGTSTEVSGSPTGETFGQWIAAAFPGVTAKNIIGAAATPEKDGIPNLLKFFLGMRPSTPGAAAISSGPDGHGNMVLSFRMSRNLSGVSYTVEESTDMTTWSSTALRGTLVNQMPNYDNMKVVVPMNGNPRLLLRLAITTE